MNSVIDQLEEDAALELKQILLHAMGNIATMMNAERSTIFLHDEKENVLWSAIMQGETVNEIRVPADRGVIGHVWTHKEMANIPDAYQDPRFNQTVDKATGFRTRSILCGILQTMQGKPFGVVQVLNKKAGKENLNDNADGVFNQHDEMLLNLLGQHVGMTLENTRMRQDLAKNHKQLQVDYQKIEGEKNKLTGHVHSEKTKLLIAAIFILPLSAFIISYVNPDLEFLKSHTTIYAKPVSEITQNFRTTTPVMGSIREPLFLVDKLRPLEVVNHVSPLSGKVKEKKFAYGQKVEQGQVLLEINTAEEEVKVRDAQSSYYQSKEAMDKLLKLQNSSEYTQAVWRRNQAKTAQEKSHRELAESQRLFKEGIISRVEMENSEESAKQADFNLQSAEDSLLSMREQANPERITIARMALENAQHVLRDAQERIKKSQVRAQISGIIIKPSAAPGQGQNVPEIDRGVALAEGSLMFAIANVESYALQVYVDEINLFRIKEKQKVEVTGEAFPNFVLRGYVQHVSYQAASMDFQAEGGGGDSSAPATFPVRIVLSFIPDGIKEVLHPGMSARAEIVLNENINAMLVPIQAVTMNPFDRIATVEILIPDKNIKETRSVKVGAVDGSLVEIVEGLQVTDQLVLP
ncbi:MAG: GAF domain-containing protein [Magnetococcus sp. DMHC-1]